MATVAQLAARPYQEIGYLFVVEGWPVAFTNRVELAGSGASSWIGTAEGARTVALGLEVPKSVKLGIGIVESGMPIDDSLTVTIVDRDGHLIAFNQDEVGTVAWDRLAASTDPAPETLLSSNGNDVTVRGAWINGEAIGSAGERRLFQILPGGDLPGYDHASIDTEAGLATLRASTVQTAARHLEGRPCALYVIRKDPATGAWPSWADQHASGYSLWWWGTVRGLAAESHAWTIDCDGPSAWLRRSLNVTMPAEWAPLEAVFELADGEEQIAISLALRAKNGEDVERCATSAFGVSDVVTSGATPDVLATEINNRIQDLVNDVGPDNTFETAGAEATFNNTEVQIRIYDNTAGPDGYSQGALLALRMHTRVWTQLGWDLSPNVQGRANLADVSSVFEVQAEGGTQLTVKWLGLLGDIANDPPIGGFWTGIFTTVPLGQDWSISAVDNKGAARIYRPINQGGATTVLQPEAGHTFSLGYGLDAPYMIGQLAKPPADVTIGSGACDRAGIMAFRGSFKKEVDGDVTTREQVGRVSWVDDTNHVAAEAITSRPLVYLEEWLDPRLFGSTEKPLDVAWAVNDLEFVPVALLGHSTTDPDYAHAVLLRLLLSSGTASWSGAGDTATLTPGANSHGVNSIGNDKEIADLGLCIPADMVDRASFVAAAAALPKGGTSSPLNLTKLAYVGPFDSQQTIEDIIKPRGWCFSLKGGKYGLFSRAAPLDVEDVEVALTARTVAADPDALPPGEDVDFRPLEPVDLIKVSYGSNMLGGEGDERELTVKARDPRAAQRRGNATVDIEGRSLLANGTWIVPFTELWGDQLARWFAEPHAMVTITIKGDTARDLWPGTIVSVSSAWVATRDGAYGMNARVGRVVSVERDTQTMAATCEVLVAAGDPTTVRRFAPVARLLDTHTTVEARHDAATRTIFCYADAFGRDADASDVAAFVEPAWSTTGGVCKAQIYESTDGVTWAAGATFEVESVSSIANSITYTAATLTGTIPERRACVVVLADYDAQDADSWPRAVFGVASSADGLFGSGDIAGHPWSP